MLSTPAIFVGLAILTGAVRGFLLPPTVSSLDEDLIKSIPSENAAQLGEQTLDLKCVGCPVLATDDSGDNVWLQGVDSDLLFTFSIVHDGIDTLSLNGVQLYPPQDLSINPVTAPQVTAHGQRDLRLGYELTIRPVAKSDDDQIELISVDLQVVEIADQFVNGLDNIEVKLLKLPSGNLLLGNLLLQPSKNPIVNPSDSGEDCSTLICKWRSIVSTKLSQLKSKSGCGSRAHSQHVAHNSHRHHGHHRHHHKHIRIARFFFALKSVAIHVLIPVFVGVAVGMTASLVGMLVGNFVIFFWRALYRRGQKGSYSRLRQVESDLLVMNREGKLKLDTQAPPPLYEAVVDEKMEL